MTPKPFWPAALAAALLIAVPAAHAAEAERPSLPKCLAHAKALCFSHHPVGLALDVASSLFWDGPQYNVAAPPGYPDACPIFGTAAPGCVTPACACIPASGANGKACAMPPPAPVGASMPCATLPMPQPVTGAFPAGFAEPLPAFAEPLPVYAPCCTTAAPAPAHYVVEAKLLRSGPAGEVLCTDCKCMTAEGASVEMAVSAPAGALGVCVARAGKHKVGVELALECCHAEKCGKDGERMQCDCARACRTVRVGKPARLLLRKGPGDEETWAEVTVSEASHAGPERIAKAPRPVPPACPGAVAGVAAAVGQMCGCQTWVGGMTLPSGCYLQHPPQYFPPAPVFPLTRDLAPQDVAWSTAAPGGMVVPAPVPVPVMAVPVPAPARPAASGVIRAAVKDGKPWLEMQSGAACMHCRCLVLQSGPEAVKITAANGSVRVRSAEMKATADGVRTLGAHRIVLEGHVRLTCREMHLKADKLEMRLDGEHVEVRATTAP